MVASLLTGQFHHNNVTALGKLLLWLSLGFQGQFKVLVTIYKPFIMNHCFSQDGICLASKNIVRFVYLEFPFCMRQRGHGLLGKRVLSFQLLFFGTPCLSGFALFSSVTCHVLAKTSNLQNNIT